MDLMKAAHEREALRQLAYQYGGFPEQIIAQGIGRQPDLPDLKEFMHHAIGFLMGRMYMVLLECEGHEKADQWTKMVLGTAGTWIRMQGSDVVLKFDVSSKIVPNTLHKKKDPEVEQNRQVRELQKDLGTVPPCECKLDPDGSCPTCVPLMVQHFSSGFEPFFKAREATKTKVKTCRACSDSQIDFGLAAFVPKLLTICEDGSEESKAMANELLNMLYMMAQQFGAVAIPRTERAWTEGMAKLAIKATPAAQA